MAVPQVRQDVELLRAQGQVRARPNSGVGLILQHVLPVQARGGQAGGVSAEKVGGRCTPASCEQAALVLSLRLAYCQPLRRAVYDVDSGSSTRVLVLGQQY